MAGSPGDSLARVRHEMILSLKEDVSPTSHIPHPRRHNQTGDDLLLQKRGNSSCRVVRHQAVVCRCCSVPRQVGIYMRPRQQTDHHTTFHSFSSKRYLLNTIPPPPLCEFTTSPNPAASDMGSNQLLSLRFTRHPPPITIKFQPPPNPPHRSGRRYHPASAPPTKLKIPAVHRLRPGVNCGRPDLAARWVPVS